MSCRHDLALGTCRRCYPSTGTIDPDAEEEYEPNLEGPGAIAREEYAERCAVVQGGGRCQRPRARQSEDRFDAPAAIPLVGEADMRRWAPSWRTDQIGEFLNFGKVVALAQSKLQSPPRLTDAQIASLAKLASVADAYEQGNLDEHRPEWGEKCPEDVELLAGRGGRTLLTLADAFAAREALRGATSGGG
jgi:hypothetical protein